MPCQSAHYLSGTRCWITCPLQDRIAYWTLLAAPVLLCGCLTIKRETCPISAADSTAGTFDLSGRLIATPNLGGIHVNDVPEFEPPKLGLREARCVTFLNLAFVNLDGQATPLEDFPAPARRCLAQYG
jgi:hypothetical protein